ncbi:MAG TPA: transglycosylase SLT domain-containing protein [Steroidobacteraceae bacterium]|nr:transglycosylase SLT domain-containing protein [Steroidobacteraceae bacterium]
MRYVILAAGLVALLGSALAREHSHAAHFAAYGQHGVQEARAIAPAYRRVADGDQYVYGDQYLRADVGSTPQWQRTTYRVARYAQPSQRQDFAAWSAPNWTPPTWNEPTRNESTWNEPSRNTSTWNAPNRNAPNRSASTWSAPYGAGDNSELESMAAAQAGANGVPASLVDRVIKRESGYNPGAVSSGNYGLMQIRLGTARALGYAGSAAGLLDPQTNMTYAVRYLAGAYRAAGGDESRAVALYARGYYDVAAAQGFSPYGSQATPNFKTGPQAAFANPGPYDGTAPAYGGRYHPRRPS